MEKDARGGLEDHALGNEAQTFDIEGRDRSYIAACVEDMTGRSPAFDEAIDQFLWHAANDLFGSRMKGHHWSDQARRHRSAQGTVSLD